MIAVGEVPIHIRVHLTHALLQHVADAEGIRLLHVKGPAVHPDLLLRDGDGEPLPRHSTDADVLVQPDRAKDLVRAIRAVGARQVNTFRTGSPFEHASTVWFDRLGYADIHRFFPGIGLRPTDAFELMWGERQDTEIAHRRVSVPSQLMQRMILLLHAARSGSPDSPDKLRAWNDATDAERAALRDLARALDAEVALAAAIGELDQHITAPEYELWHQFSRNPTHTRTDEWRARIKAARSPLHRMSLALRATQVNTDRLAMDLGHEPSRAEIRAAWVGRIRRAFDEATGRAT